MKTKHNYGLTARFVVLLALLSATVPVAQAQEYIREVRNHYDKWSIVREVDETACLVCDYHLGQTVFSLVDEWGITVPQLFLGYIDYSDSCRINDFEIYKDTVYFCGTVWFQDRHRAIWGYFPLAGFPNVDVYHNVRPYLSLNDLEVFSVDETGKEIHVVMTGIMFEDEEYVFDEVRTAPHFFYEYISDVFSSPTYFPDLTITDKYVDVSYYFQTGNLGGECGVVFMSKPTTVGTTIFSCTTQKRTMSDYIDFPIWVKGCEGDASVAVYNGSDRIYVTAFDVGPQHFASISLDSVWRFFTIKDISYSKLRQDLDILINPTFTSTPSIIFHIYPSHALGAGSVFKHTYTHDVLSSIDRLSLQPDYFMASGHNPGNMSLCVYKYKHNQWWYCAESGTTTVRGEGEPGKPVTIIQEYDREECPMTKMQSFDMEVPLIPICE